MSKHYILWLDCESSGLDPDKNGILSLALVVEDAETEQIIDKAYFEMNPVGRVIEDGALAVNGFTREQIASFKPWGDVRLEVLAFMDKYIDKYSRTSKFIVGGYNVNFDMKMLESWFREWGDNYMGSYIKLGFYIDPFKSLPMLQWCGKLPAFKNNKLTTVCEHFGIDVTNAHNALDDTIMTRELAYKIKEMI